MELGEFGSGINVIGGISGGHHFWILLPINDPHYRRRGRVCSQLDRKTLITVMWNLGIPPPLVINYSPTREDYLDYFERWVDYEKAALCDLIRDYIEEHVGLQYTPLSTPGEILE